MRSSLLVRIQRLPAQYAHMRICACGHMLSQSMLILQAAVML